MPRRSARNVVKDSEYDEKQVLDVTKDQTASIVADVIDDFVAEAERQEYIVNDDEGNEKAQEDEEGSHKVSLFIQQISFDNWIDQMIKTQNNRKTTE